MNPRVALVNLASLVALASLLVMLISAFLAFTGDLEFKSYLLIFNLASLTWFLSAPFWFIPHLFGPAMKQAAKSAWLRPKS